MMEDRTTPPVPNEVESKDFFERSGKKGVFIALGLLMLLSFFVFKDYILLKKLYLFQDIGSDTVNGLWPVFQNFANYSQKYGIPTWSFEEGMGQNIIGGFLRDPFMIIEYLAGPGSMPKIFIYTELIKIISGGLVFYLFLKQLQLSNFAATIGCLLFSFSGFMIVGSGWYLFSFEAFNIALVLLGFELYFQKNKWGVFVASIVLTAISMPFNLYVTGVILVVYMVFRLGQTNRFSVKSFLQLGLKLSFLGLIALLLSAPFLLEGILQLLESPRGSGSNSYFNSLASKSVFALTDKLQFGSFIARLFSSDYLGTGNYYTGWGNFLEAPLSYCGIISLMLMPQIFSSISKPQRKWYLFWLLIWLIPTMFPYFRYMFWLFSGDYYRVFSFCLSLVFIVYAVLALDTILKTKKINLYILAGTLVVGIVLLSINYFKGTGVQIDQAIALFSKEALVVYACLLFFMVRKTEYAFMFKYALLVFICYELTYLSAFSVNRRDAVFTWELSEKKGYNDYSVEAVKYIKEREKEFYRIDKNYFSSGAMHISLNDNKIHDYYATSIYTSFGNNNYTDYLKENNIIKRNSESESRYIKGLVGAPVMQLLNNVKYIIAYGYSNPVWYRTHDSVAKFANIVVLKSKFNLPFGYTYRQYIKQSDFAQLSVGQKDIVSLFAFVLKDEDIATVPGLKAYNLADTVLNIERFSYVGYRPVVERLAENTLKVQTFSDQEIKGTIKTDSPKMMYLSFPFDKGWHLTLDGADAGLMYISNGMTGIYLPKGDHTVELHYQTRFFYKGLLLMVLGIIVCFGLVVMNRKGFKFLKSHDDQIKI